jgi:predicted SprT family Zn-dependent metalloprotease
VPPLDPRRTYKVRLHEGRAWLQCQHCFASFDRDEELTQRMHGESMGCAHCGQISYIGKPE